MNIKVYILAFMITLAACSNGIIPYWDRPNDPNDPLYPTAIYTLKNDDKSQALLSKIKAQGFEISAPRNVDRDFAQCPITDLPKIKYSWTGIDGHTDQGESLPYCNYKVANNYIKNIYENSRASKILLTVEVYEIDPEYIIGEKQ